MDAYAQQALQAFADAERARRLLDRKEQELNTCVAQMVEYGDVDSCEDYFAGTQQFLARYEEEVTA